MPRKGHMNKLNQRHSLFSRTFWMGMGVFFVVFCSSPVKKYIRLQLYKQKQLVENTSGQHFSTHDVKDCTIAERNDQTQASLLSFIHGPLEIPGFNLCLVSTCNSFTCDTFYPSANKISIAFPETNGVVMSIPLYLRIRRLQV